MVNKTIFEWLGSMIPLKILDTHHNHPICFGHTIVLSPQCNILSKLNGDFLLLVFHKLLNLQVKL